MEKEKPRKKKCPVCNSTRTEFSDEGFKCKRCNYINKPHEKFDQESQ